MARHVVLVCLDTVRRDYFEQYGTAVRECSDQSFEQCRAASSWSVPSHVSMFTSTLPSEHGFLSATPAFKRLSTGETFLGDLPDHRTVGISANPYASPIFGFDSLFDEFHHITPSCPFEEGLPPSAFWHENETDGLRRYGEFLTSCLSHEYPVRSFGNGVYSQVEKLFRNSSVQKPVDDGCNRILRKARSVLANTDRPTFLFINLMDAHGPLTNVRGYNQSLLSKDNPGRDPGLDPLQLTLDGTFEDKETEIRHYRELYAAAIEYSCRKVASFCTDVGEETAIIVTSDHGEQMAELPPPRRFGHVTPDMTEELLHVPLELRHASVDVDEAELFSHLSLGRLVTSIANETSFDSCTPVVAESSGLGVAHPPRDHERFDYWNRTVRAFYSTDQKVVWDSLGNIQLFSRKDGNYVLSENSSPETVPEEAEEAFQVAIDTVSPHKSPTSIDPTVQSQLEELGYLS